MFDNLFLEENTYVLVGDPENEGLVNIRRFVRKSFVMSNPPLFFCLCPTSDE